MEGTITYNVHVEGDFVQTKNVYNTVQARADVTESIPRPRDYNAVREYVEAWKVRDQQFKEFCLKSTWPQLAEKLTNEFGWLVDPNSLARNARRH